MSGASGGRDVMEGGGGGGDVTSDPIKYKSVV